MVEGGGGRSGEEVRRVKEYRKLLKPWAGKRFLSHGTIGPKKSHPVELLTCLESGETLVKFLPSVLQFSDLAGARLVQNVTPNKVWVSGWVFCLFYNEMDGVRVGI